jgi:hypothetical protein
VILVVDAVAPGRSDLGRVPGDLEQRSMCFVNAGHAPILSRHPDPARKRVRLSQPQPHGNSLLRIGQQSALELGPYVLGDCDLGIFDELSIRQSAPLDGARRKRSLCRKHRLHHRQKKAAPAA